MPTERLPKTVCQLDNQQYYIGTTVADPDPLDDNHWLMPAGCVSTTPPESNPNQIAQWDNDQQQWRYLPDYRGTTVYSIVDGRASEIEQVGALPDDVTLSPMPSSLHQWDAKTKQWVLSKAKQAEQLSMAKNEKRTEINAKAQAIITKIAKLDEVPDFEVQTWEKQRAEALAWQTNHNVATPMLTTIAQARGIDVDKLRQAALAKAIAFTQLSAIVAGQRQAYIDRLDKADDINTVANINVVYHVEMSA